MPAPEEHRPLAHRDGCLLDATHPGSCCTDNDPFGIHPHGPTCPRRPEQAITADRLNLAVRYATVGGGFTDADVEFPRLRADQARGDLDWDRMAGELADGLDAKARAMLADLPDEPPSDDDAPPEDAGDGIPTAKVRRYQELRNAEAASKAEAAAIKQEADALEAVLVDAFGEAGMQSVNIDGQTVYLHRSTYASWNDVDPEHRQALLLEAGAGDLITPTVNANTLAAWLREMIGDEDNPGPGLPPELIDKLGLGERFAVRIKTSTSRAKPKPKPRA